MIIWYLLAIASAAGIGVTLGREIAYHRYRHPVARLLPDDGRAIGHHSHRERS